jgi:hypothetical protein
VPITGGRVSAEHYLYICYGEQGNVGGRSGDEIEGTQIIFTALPILSLPIHDPFLLVLELTSPAPRDPENLLQRSLLRLRRSLSTMGLAKVRRLHMPKLRRCASGPRRAHQLRAKYNYGRLQGGGNRTHAPWRQYTLERIL